MPPLAAARCSHATYLAECFWPGVTEAKLAAAAERVADDRSVTCQQLIFIPADEIVLCLFQAPSEAAINEAARRAGLPSERIVESIRIRPRRRRRSPAKSANVDASDATTSGHELT
jgi:Protein of unknown function (DUF4242)